jgi:hypothetical protein
MIEYNCSTTTPGTNPVQSVTITVTVITIHEQSNTCCKQNAPRDVTTVTVQSASTEYKRITQLYVHK